MADLSLLSTADLKAFDARKRWLERAKHPDRGGKQLAPRDLDWEILLFLAGRGFGKLLDVTTPLPTPTGWTSMGEVQVGDEVFDEAGTRCRVTWASAIQTPMEAYRVSFSDGSWLDACAEHQWVTWTHAERKAFLRSPYEDATRFPTNWPTWRMLRSCGYPRQTPAVYGDSPGPQVRTTRQILDTLTYGKRGDTNHCVPQCAALDLPDTDLPLPPYLLGAWLGDGDTAGGALTCHETDMGFFQAQFEASGFSSRPVASDSQRLRIDGLTTLLRQWGLQFNKHIPAYYLRASSRQRMALLRGLMDTDGGNDNANLVSFTSCIPELADAVAELVISLGMKVRRDDRLPICTTNGVTGQRSYRVAFTPHEQVFCMPRKAERIRFECGQSLRRHHRMIEAVERIASPPMRCITVDSPNSMYLAGRAMIPTHNTAAQVQWAWWEAWRVPDLIVHAISPTLSDVRGTTFEGPAGFLATIPAECLLDGTKEKAYNKTSHELRLANGSLIRGFGAVEEAGRLRGPQCAAMICDELREWEKPAGNLELAMNNALFGLRLPYPDGTPSRAVMGTTRRPIPFLKRFEKRPGVRVIHGTSYENLRNLSATFRSQILSLVGTKLGRQEIDSLDIEDDSDPTVIKPSWIRLWPFDPASRVHKPLPPFSFIIESYDTAASEKNFDVKTQETDPTACIVLGVFNVAQAFNEAERKRLRLRSKYACILLDCWSERLGLPALLDKARAQYRKKWGPREHARRADVVLIENKSSGPGVRQFLIKWGVPAWPMEPRGSKLMRLHGVSPLIYQGMLFVPESTRDDRSGLPIAWADQFLGQLCAFPGKAEFEGEIDDHDDYVDVVSQAFTYLRDNGMLAATPEEQFADLEEKIDHDRDEAKRMYADEKRRAHANPYG